MAVIDVPLLLVTLVVLVVIAGTVGVVLPRIMRATERAQAAVGEMGSVLERVLGAIRTVKASGAEGREAAALDAAAGQRLRARACGTRATRRWSAPRPGLAVQVAFLAVLGVGGARVADGSLAVGDLIAFLLYLFYISDPIAGIATGAVQLQAGIAAVHRLRRSASCRSRRTTALTAAAARTTARSCASTRSASATATTGRWCSRA